MKLRFARMASFLLLGCLWAVPALAQVVISEFRTRGPNGGNDEFVEIWNTTAAAVNIGGWKLNGSNNAGTTGTRATVPANVMIGPGCYYLFTNAATAGYSGIVPGNQTYNTGFTDTGGLALLRPDNSISDQVGMDNGSAYKEGTVLAPTALNANQSYERKPGGVSGHGIDTGDNSNDFLFNGASSNPQNAATTCLTATPAQRNTWGVLKTMYR